MKNGSNITVNVLFYTSLIITMSYALLIGLLPFILKKTNKKAWLNRINAFAGNFALVYVLIVTIPTYQVIVYHFLCYSSSEYYSEATCSGSGVIIRTILSAVLLCVLIPVCWLLGSCLKTSIPFGESYLNSSQRHTYIDYIVWPLVSTVLHMTNISVVRVVNIYAISVFSLYSIGCDIWQMACFDISMRLYYFKVKVVFGWFFFAPALLYVNLTNSGSWLRRYGE